jgi:phytoene desaturase
MEKRRKAVIIGAGIGGLSTAPLLAKEGYEVLVIDNNERLGGRANWLEAGEYKFDMGPSWYLMPEVFERYFGLLGEDVNDLLTLKKLDPSYRIFFPDDGDVIDISPDVDKMAEYFESLEVGAGDNFREYLRLAKYQYDVSMKDFVYRNYDSIFDFFNPKLVAESVKLSFFSTMDQYVRKFFKSIKIQKILQYTLVFLGGSPYNTPALYSLMSHVDFSQGVFYPMGGMYEIVKALEKVGKKRGVKYMTNTKVTKIEVSGRMASAVRLENGEIIEADLVVSNADIAHTEMQLLDSEWRAYDQKYWDQRTLAPSAIILYLGINKSLPEFLHHNLVFSKDWPTNFAQIFDDPQLPDDPSFYINVPSRIDKSLAPKGKETMFILVPVASGLEISPKELEIYADKILAILEQESGVKDLRKHIEYQKIFSVKDFETRYNSLNGTALGLAHTLGQTAIFRPSNYSKKVDNLYYVGASTVPGIGVPMCLISAELVMGRIR